jgi:hypothetical protein
MKVPFKTYLFDYSSLVYIVYSPFRFEKRILWFKCQGCQTHCLWYCLCLCPCHLPFNRCFLKIWITVFEEILCCGKQRNGQIKFRKSNASSSKWNYGHVLHTIPNTAHRCNQLPPPTQTNAIALASTAAELIYSSSKQQVYVLQKFHYRRLPVLWWFYAVTNRFAIQIRHVSEC